MKFIDSHSHLYLEEFSEDLPEVIERARSVGVSHILLPNIDSSTVNPMLEVCKCYPGYCFPMMGLHPTSVHKNTYQEELHRVEEQLSRSSDYIAVGEVGMDLYWDKTYKLEQMEVFERQIQLALKYKIPLVIHSRDAFNEICEVMEPYKKSALQGVFHSFTGTEQEALKLLQFENFMLGINGVVTFKNSTLSQILVSVPLTRLLIETDSPYLTPVPYRGKRNESGYLQFTLQKLAEIYQTNPDKIAEVTIANTLKVFSNLI
ncbi:MAG: TatD family hydrolase [Bacteroides sp.]|nr:TatD family hydrolase [Bacteroides sp.]